MRNKNTLGQALGHANRRKLERKFSPTLTAAKVERFLEVYAEALRADVKQNLRTNHNLFRKVFPDLRRPRKVKVTKQGLLDLNRGPRRGRPEQQVIWDGKRFIPFGTEYAVVAGQSGKKAPVQRQVRSTVFGGK